MTHYPTEREEYDFAYSDMRLKLDGALAALKQARREYGAFGTLSGETLAQMDEALSPSARELGGVRADPTSPEGNASSADDLVTRGE